jgi:hypothetical protein
MKRTLNGFPGDDGLHPPRLFYQKKLKETYMTNSNYCVKCYWIKNYKIVQCMLGIIAFLALYLFFADNPPLFNKLIHSGVIATYLSFGIYELLKKGNCPPNCDTKFTKFENNFYCLYDNPKTMTRWFWVRLILGAIAAVCFIFLQQAILNW